jgi:ribosomal protein L37AE/L43A
MNKENTRKLIDMFPKLYHGYTKSMTESLMCFGFECGDGWFDLIKELSQKITEIDPEGECKAVQVKEKFGTLRFYTFGSNDQISNLIVEYEEKSAHVCEDCGSNINVKTSGEGWIRSLCEECRLSKR